MLKKMSKIDFHVIIPARYESSRLPGKPLAKIKGKEMILHVCERANLSGAKTVCVATDNIKIKTIVEKAGYTAVMTRDDHESGSDRVYEAAEILGLSDKDIIVNVQGDEPFIPIENISQVANIIVEKNANMSTLCCTIDDEKEASNPNAVKVVFDKNNKAIYFSRSILPYVRSNIIDETSNFELGNHFRHIGIYAYKKHFLKQFIKWPISNLESLEKLEQLRALENGEAIYLDVLQDSPPSGIDTEEDLRIANL